MQYDTYYANVCKWEETGPGIYVNGYINISNNVIEVLYDESKKDIIEKIIENNSPTALLDKNNMVELISLYDSKSYYVTNIKKKAEILSDNVVYKCSNFTSTAEGVYNMVCIGQPSNLNDSTLDVCKYTVKCKGVEPYGQLCYPIQHRPILRGKNITMALRMLPVKDPEGLPLFVLEPRTAIDRDPQVTKLYEKRRALYTIKAYASNEASSNNRDVYPIMGITMSTSTATPAYILTNGTYILGNYIAKEMDPQINIHNNDALLERFIEVDKATVDDIDEVELSFELDSLELPIGVKRYIKIKSNVVGYDVVVVNPNIVRYHSKTKELEGLSVGSTALICRYSKNNKVEKEVYLYITVTAEELKSKNKILLHNRSTNRLTTVVLGANAEENITYYLPRPNKSGILLTQDKISKSVSNIKLPKIIYPADGITDFEGNIECTEYVDTNKLNPIIRTIWQFSRTPDFKHIILERRKGNKRYNNIYSMSSVFSLLTFYVRVKYVTKDRESGWSNPIKISTKNNAEHDGKGTILKGNSWDGGYMGTIEPEEQRDNFVFVGYYRDFIQYNYKDLIAGWVMLHNNKFYILQQNLTASTIVEPGTNNDIWRPLEQEELDKLPTCREVNNLIGIGIGVTDNNADGLSHTVKTCGIKHDPGYRCAYFKFIYHGRIYYVPKLPMGLNICWNDIAKREAVYGDRTIRVGNRNLYRVGLPKEDMWMACMEKMYGASLNGEEKWSNLDPEKDLMLQYGTWVEDFDTSIHKRRALYSPEYGVYNVSCYQDVRGRTFGYRPILEYIVPGNEPYNNLPEDDIFIETKPRTDHVEGNYLEVIENEEKFIYDPLTDTGWFGYTHSKYFVNGNMFNELAGMTTGGNINDQCQWQKFYWHGKVLYTNIRPIKHNTHTRALQDRGVLYPIDMYAFKPNKVYIRGIWFTTALMLLTSRTPHPKTASLKDFHPYTEFNYGQFYELLVRTTIHLFNHTDKYMLFVNKSRFQIGPNFSKVEQSTENYYDHHYSSSNNGYEVHGRGLQEGGNHEVLIDTNMGNWGYYYGGWSYDHPYASGQQADDEHRPIVYYSGYFTTEFNHLR